MPRRTPFSTAPALAAYGRAELDDLAAEADGDQELIRRILGQMRSQHRSSGNRGWVTNPAYEAEQFGVSLEQYRDALQALSAIDICETDGFRDELLLIRLI